MATGHIILPILAAVPDPSLPPGIAFYSGTNRPYLTFDGTASIEKCIWTFQMPSDYASAPNVDILWSAASVTTGNVQWTIKIMAVTANTDTDAIGTDSYAAENTIQDSHLGTTATRLHLINTGTLSNADSLAASDYVALQLSRDYSDAEDTIAEDCYVHAVMLKYTTT